MAATSSWNGHEIFYREGCWVYRDNGQKVKDVQRRNCGYCQLSETKDGHDGCLGTLDGIMNACCGHGVSEDAYLQYPDKSCIRGQEALIEIENLKN